MVERIVNSKIAARSVFNIGNVKYAVFDAMIEGVQVIDYEWRYFYVNDSVARHGLSTKAALLGNTMMEKYPGIENTEIFKTFKQCMSKRVTAEVLTEFVFPDGSVGWFELSVQPVPEGILILSSDITQLKRVEAELKQKLFERTQMLAQITKQKHQLEEFCQIIAHNLRAPLSNLLLLSDMIKDSESTEEKMHFMEIQKPVVDLLHKTFEELVDATQVRMDYTIKRNPVDLEKHIKRTLNSLKKEIKNSNAIVTYDFSDVPTISYSKKYIESILYNLISNAIKFRSQEKTAKIHVRSYKKDGWVCIEVKDNGLGIDMKKHKSDLFKLHKTFHNHPSAKGFGLFITKTQIETLGGEIIAKSKINNGSTFTAKLYKTTDDE